MTFSANQADNSNARLDSSRKGPNRDALGGLGGILDCRGAPYLDQSAHRIVADWRFVQSLPGTRSHSACLFRIPSDSGQPFSVAAIRCHAGHRSMPGRERGEHRSLGATPLGKYWSGRITLKVDHHVIQTGPYAFVRHPIYSGILLALLGTYRAFSVSQRLTISMVSSVKPCPAFSKETVRSAPALRSKAASRSASSGGAIVS